MELITQACVSLLATEYLLKAWLHPHLPAHAHLAALEHVLVGVLQHHLACAAQLALDVHVHPAGPGRQAFKAYNLL